MALGTDGDARRLVNCDRGTTLPEETECRERQSDQRIRYR